MKSPQIAVRRSARALMAGSALALLATGCGSLLDRADTYDWMQESLKEQYRLA